MGWSIDALKKALRFYIGEVSSLRGQLKSMSVFSRGRETVYLGQRIQVIFSPANGRTPDRFILTSLSEKIIGIELGFKNRKPVFFKSEDGAGTNNTNDFTELGGLLSNLLSLTGR